MYCYYCCFFVGCFLRGSELHKYAKSGVNFPLVRIKLTHSNSCYFSYPVTTWYGMTLGICLQGKGGYALAGFQAVTGSNLTPTGWIGMDSPCQAYRDLWMTGFWKMDVLYYRASFYKISLLPTKPVQPECFLHSTHPPHHLFSIPLTCPSSLFQTLLISPIMLNTQLVLHSNTIKKPSLWSKRLQIP